MIFKAKSINTVDNAGKQVDGMKRPREPPTGGIKMDIGRILPTEAAAILNVSPQFVRGSNATGKTPDRNGGADVLNLDVSHFGKTACRLFRKEHRKRD